MRLVAEHDMFFRDKSVDFMSNYVADSVDIELKDRKYKIDGYSVYIHSFCYSVTGLVLYSSSLPRFLAAVMISISFTLLVAQVASNIKKLKISPALYVFLALSALMFLQSLLIIYSNTDRYDNRGIQSPLVVLVSMVSTAFFVLVYDSSKYLRQLSNFMAAFGVISICAKILGYDVLSNDNHYSFMLIPLLVSCLVDERWKKSIAIFIIIMVASIITEARLTGGLAIILIPAALLWKFKLLRILAVIILISFCLYQISMVENKDAWWNQILTNRPIIWGYYYEHFLESVMLGFGGISELESSSVSLHLANIYDRGFGARYGTQSMLLLYLFENGLPITIMIYSLVCFVVLKKTRVSLLVALLSVASLLETVKIGSPSVFGQLITILILSGLSAAYIEKSKM